MIYRNTNFCGQTITLAGGDVLEDCNLAQDQPHTPIATGVVGLTFVRCNLRNCDIPDSAMAIDCARAQVRINRTTTTVTNPDGTTFEVENESIEVVE